MCVELSLLILKSATFVFEAGIFIVKEIIGKQIRVRIKKDVQVITIASRKFKRMKIVYFYLSLLFKVMNRSEVNSSQQTQN